MLTLPPSPKSNLSIIIECRREKKSVDSHTHCASVLMELPGLKKNQKKEGQQGDWNRRCLPQKGRCNPVDLCEVVVGCSKMAAG